LESEIYGQGPNARHAYRPTSALSKPKHPHVERSGKGTNKNLSRQTLVGLKWSFAHAQQAAWNLVF